MSYLYGFNPISLLILTLLRCLLHSCFTRPLIFFIIISNLLSLYEPSPQLLIQHMTLYSLSNVYFLLLSSSRLFPFSCASHNLSTSCTLLTLPLMTTPSSFPILHNPTQNVIFPSDFVWNSVYCFSKLTPWCLDLSATYQNSLTVLVHIWNLSGKIKVISPIQPYLLGLRLITNSFLLPRTELPLLTPSDVPLCESFGGWVVHSSPPVRGIGRDASEGKRERSHWGEGPLNWGPEGLLTSQVTH